jgi:ABC-type transport system involved in multi-copper enzyme maturation permease subunit
MVLLYLFSSLIASTGSASTIAGVILLYAVVLFFCSFMGFTISAFAGYGPKPWADFLGITMVEKSADEGLVAVADIPPLGECKSDVSIANIYKAGTTREVCTSAGPRSHISRQPETRYKDTKEMVSWTVFAADRVTAIARCYCLR